MLKYTVFSLLIIASGTYAMERNPMTISETVGYYVATSIREGVPRAHGYTTNALRNPAQTYSQLPSETRSWALYGTIIGRTLLGNYSTNNNQ